MKLIKTRLVQAQEYTREVDDMIGMIKSYENKINESLVIPSRMFGKDFINPSNSFPRKPALIKIDVTKLP